jgi:hypothetical protein
VDCRRKLLAHFSGRNKDAAPPSAPPRPGAMALALIRDTLARSRDVAASAAAASSSPVLMYRRPGDAGRRPSGDIPRVGDDDSLPRVGDDADCRPRVGDAVCLPRVGDTDPLRRKLGDIPPPSPPSSISAGSPAGGRSPLPLAVRNTPVLPLLTAAPASGESRPGSGHANPEGSGMDGARSSVRL